MTPDKNNIESTKEPEIRYVPVQFIEGYAPQTANDEVEIDLMDILKKIWDGRSTIIKVTLVFTILGILYAFSTPKEFTTTVKLLPEVQQNNNLGRLGGLAAQFGLGGATSGITNDVLPPQIYPEILNSTDFLHEIIKKNIFVEELSDSLNIQEFYNDYQKSNLFIAYTIGLPFKILALFQTKPELQQVETTTNISYKQFTPKEIGSIGGVRAAVKFNRDQLTGVLSINVTTQAPEVTVQLANHIIEALSNYLITYRTEKSRQNLTFLEQRHAEARESFAIEQVRLARFRDQNQGNLTAATRTIEQNIQSEYNVKLNVYNSLTEQLEQARIKLQEDTPVVSVIQESIYPYRKSAPNRLMLVIFYTFIGGIIGVMTVFLKPMIVSAKQKLN